MRSDSYLSGAVGLSVLAVRGGGGRVDHWETCPVVLGAKGHEFEGHEPILALAQYDDAIRLECDAPDGLARHGELAQESARLHIPYFGASVVSARDNESLVKLQARDGIVVCA